MHQNMVQYFYVRLLYQLSASVMAVLVAAINFKMCAYARSKRLERVLRWAAPGLVNSVIAVIVIALEDIVFVLDARQTVAMYTVTAILCCTSFVFCTVSIYRLWEMVREMPPADIEPQHQSETWPPAPTQPY